MSIPLRIILPVFLSILLSISCKKTNSVGNNELNQGSLQKKIVYPLLVLDSLSNINKTTSWYSTNKSFTQLFEVPLSYYWGFELKDNDLIPYNTGTTAGWGANKSYYWNDLGTYLYTDLTGDGKKDLWAYYWKNPWPTNAKGLHLFSEYEKNRLEADVQYGLTQVRKCVLADFNNDNQKEIMLFSSGFDAPPFPGDSLAIFYVKEKRYQYLNKDIGYFHGGATGDVNNDGFVDILAYSGGSMVIPSHPTFYLNKGSGNFMLSNNIFKNFKTDGSDNYYTVELFDIDGDGWLDLFLGGQEKLILIFNEMGSFDRAKAKIVQSEKLLELMDISFLDFDMDGKLDILTMSNKSGYNGYGLRMFLNKGNQFLDVSSSYFDVIDGTGDKAWIKWIHLFDYDGDDDLDIVGDGLFGSLEGKLGRKIFWRNDEGKFKQVKL